jgi:hypothetical protein
MSNKLKIDPRVRSNLDELRVDVVRSKGGTFFVCLLGQAENIPLRIGGIALAVSSTKKLFVPREINIRPTGTLASFERIATLRSATFRIS